MNDVTPRAETAMTTLTKLLVALFLALGLLGFPGKPLAALNINSVTLDGASSVTVIPSAAISAVVNATTTGSGINAQWKSTGWRIATAPGLMVCQVHTNFTSAGTHQVIFSITAPAAAGTYNAYFIGYNGPGCGGTASATYTLVNGVIVTGAVPTVTSIVPNLGPTAGGTAVTITGTNFTGATAVTIGGAAATGITVVNGTTITATTPAGVVGAQNVVVATPSGSGTGTGLFTYVAPPTVTTNPATVVTTTGATLNGIVSSNGASTTVTFEYGLTIGYGATVSAAQSPLAAGASGVAVSATAAGLTCGSLYHFRAMGVNGAGTTDGGDLTFTTSACLAATVTTDAASLVTTTGATLNGTVSSNGTTTVVSFEYGLDTGYGTSVPAAQSPLAGGASGVAVSVALTGLTCGNVYHFRATGVNSGGTSNGSDLTLTTSSCLVALPTVTTNGASALTTSGATLNGAVSSNGASTTVSFEYGLTSGSYGVAVAADQSPLVAGAIGSAVSADVTGLTCGTLYYFRVRGENSAGISNGAELTFTTSACPPASFDAVEISQAAATRIFTKLAGAAFSLDILALGGGPAQTVSVALVDTDAASGNCSDTNSGLTAETLYTTSAGANRRVTANFTSANAARNVRVRMIDTSNSAAFCSWDNFAVRPLSFTVAASANADLTGLSAIATPAIRAGSDFTLAAATGVAGYDGTPALDATKIAAHVGAGQIGTVTGSFASGAPATGTASGTAFAYSEAGYFTLAINGVYDDSFAAVDILPGDCTDDFSNTLVGGQYGCKFGNTATTGYFGRFIPDHFTITPGTVTPACGGNFTYFSQAGFVTAFTLAARNQTNGPTQNYTGPFARLDLAGWNNFAFTATGLPGGATLAGSATVPTGSWSNGTAAVSAGHQISRPAAPVAPADVTIYARPVDLDGVTMAAPVAVQAATTLLRYGRLVLGNVYGPETEALKMQLLTEDYDGTVFVANPADTCSSYDAAALISGCTDPDLTDTLICGDVTSADVNIGHGQYFTLTPPLKTGTLLYAITTDPWLQYEWDGLDNDYNENPAAQATFGLYRGNDRIINWREIMR